MDFHPLQSAAPAQDAAPSVRCRQIGRNDVEAIGDLLAIGFKRHTRKYWADVLDFLTRRAPPEGFPKYGYMLESGGTPVGVLLILASRMPNASAVRCNGSAWYVEPAFRSLAPLLIMKSIKAKAIHTNLWPDLRILSTIEALGFKSYCNGVFAAVPALSAGPDGARIRRVKASSDDAGDIPADDLQLLRDHDSYGCLSFWCETKDRGFPVIFRRRFIKDSPLAPVAQLIYCPSIEDLVRLAGPIGRRLGRHGLLIMLVPANGPVPNLVGRYFSNKYMYYLGAEPLDLCDLAYSKAAFFAI